MQRRTFIKFIPGLLASLGAACEAGAAPEDLSDEALMKGLLGAIIPSGDTPGAREVALHLDIIRLIGTDPMRREAYGEGLLGVRRALSAHPDRIDWDEVVRGMEQSRFFRQLRHDAMELFYSKPASWEAIGYEGPPLGGDYSGYSRCGGSGGK